MPSDEIRIPVQAVDDALYAKTGGRLTCLHQGDLHVTDLGLIADAAGVLLRQCETPTSATWRRGEAFFRVLVSYPIC